MQHQTSQQQNQAVRRPAREIIEERRKRILANNKDSIQTHVEMLNKAKQQVVRWWARASGRNPTSVPYTIPTLIISLV